MHIINRAVNRAVTKAKELLGIAGNAAISESATEDLLEDLYAGRKPRLFGQNPARPRVKGRIEENYLYSTRRFPQDADDTIGAGAIAAGDYTYFGTGIGDLATTMGYSGLAAGTTNLSPLQTNMDRGGKIPNGRGFKLYELAVSFNARAGSIAAGADNIAQCLDALSMRFEKQGGQLVIQHGPIRNWPGGVGVSGFSTTTVAATSIAGAHSGDADLRGVRRFRLPRILSANESFAYILSAPSANSYATGTAWALTNYVEICIWLYGYAFDRIPE
jgi:hypothetical protein